MCQDFKPKRKNSEKRKAKSRDAARVRRSQESDIFRELTDLLPISEKIRSTLDKTSVTRLAICYIRLQELIKNECDQRCVGKEIDRRLDALYLKAFGGFVLIVGSDGFVTYLSENVSLFLGLTQMDMMAQSVYEFLHASNHEQMHDLLLCHDNRSTVECCLSLKCTLTSKGHNVNVKSAGYKVMSCSSCRLMHSDYNMFLCKPLLDPTNIEQPLGTSVFVTKHTLDMKFIFADDRAQEILGYRKDELMGRSLYNYIYGTDCAVLRSAYAGLATKGQAMTGLYRVLAAGGGYIWVETQSTIITDSKTQKPECIVCINFAVGEPERNQTVMSQMQITSKLTPPLTPDFVCSTNDVLEMDGICDSTTSTVEPVNGGADLDLYDAIFPESSDTLLVNDCGAQLILQLLDKVNEESTLQLTDKRRYIANNPLVAAAVVPDIVQEKVDLSLFAPYIPMDSEDDMLFPQMNELLNMSQIADNQMVGITETVFEPQAEDDPTQNCRGNVPIGILRLASLKKDRMLLGDASQDIGLTRIKQTVETNRLANGPPSYLPTTLVSRASGGMYVTDGHATDVQGVRNMGCEVKSSSGSTVLRNLLLSGADTRTGYAIRPEMTYSKQTPMMDKKGDMMRRNSSLWSLSGLDN